MPIDTLISIFLIITIPETIIAVWFCFRFFGIRTAGMKRKLLLHTAVVSVLLIISVGVVPPVVHPIMGVLLSTLSLSLFFRDLAWKSRLLLALSIYLVMIVIEFSPVFVDPFIGDINLIREGPFYYKFMLWPGFAALAAATWLMERRGVSPGRRVMLYLQNDRNRYMRYYFIIIFLQCFSFVLLFMARFLVPASESVILMLFVLCISVVIVVTYLALRLIANARDEAIQATQDAFVGDLMQMLTTIRGQRHDFANHVQVMYSMLKMNKLTQLEAYMADVAGEIQAVNQMSDRFPTTAFGSFLQAKSAIALERRITFEYNVPELPGELSAVKNIDLVRIVGNLVDNAFDEVMKRPENQRHVTLQIDAAGGELVISVGNTGEALSDEVRERIFTPGYSTKQGKHSGLGLPIVVERVRHYGGNVDVGYQPERGVVFTVGIPFGAGGSQGA